MKVGPEVTVDGRPALRLSDPERAMTVQDLLRHTAGLTYASRGTSLVHKAYTDAKIGDRTASNDEMVKRLSGVPLLFTPGERWEYSVSVDVQRRLIEVLTGKTLMEAFTERVFGPLGMVDTTFQVPAGCRRRLPTDTGTRAISAEGRRDLSCPSASPWRRRTSSL